MSTEFENLQSYARKRNKNEKIKMFLAKAAAECGDDYALEEVCRAIKFAVSKLDILSKKNSQESISQQMVAEAKNKQKKWWDSIQSGLGIKPEIKEESDE